MLTLSSNLAAEVVAVKIKSGERVKKGVLLIQLDTKVAAADLQQARAELAHQKLLLKEAASELQRSEELYDRTLLSEHDLTVARIAEAAAKSSYQRALFAVSEKQHNLDLRQIVAPFNARVLDVYVKTGETINGYYQSVKLITLQAEN
ncbi:MAG: biotin/lipoyl-binding protein [Chromatiales bacterium]|nr:biotin/lipoyl-binding protein [Chromatiales bacterium]